MDIQKKLEFYRSSGNQPAPKSPSSQVSSHSGLTALSEHFQAEICYPQAPYLKIHRQTDLVHVTDENLLSLHLLSRRSISSEINLEKCLFFDLETTGLAGGAGTFAFLIGLAFIRNNQLYVQQYFLPEYGREYQVFSELQQLFTAFDYIISYNGKSFDAPLLTTRFILNRFEAPFKAMEHVDLLHFARRIWKDSFDSCDLQTIEANLFNRSRTNDIPGYLIPQAYFDFLRSGVIYSVIQIINHNFYDLWTLADLALMLNQIERNPLLIQDNLARLRLAALAFELDDPEYFIKISRTSEEFDVEHQNQLKFWDSFFHKRRGNWEKAVDIWEGLSQTTTFSFRAIEELAKYYEHIGHDLNKAMDYTQRALRKLDVIQEINQSTDLDKLYLNLQYRLRRLTSKLS